MTSPSSQPRKPPNMRELATLMISILGLSLLGGGYLYLNANRVSLPFNSRGSNNNQNTNINNGNQAGNNSGIVGNNNTSEKSVLGSVVTGDNAKIDITISSQDPKFQNGNLPGYFPDRGFDSSPPDLSRFEGANVFTRDLAILGSPSFSNQEIIVQDKAYSTVFSLYGSNAQINKAAFKLNAKQKAVLLQFGLADLASGNADLTYKLEVLADGVKVWSGEIIYGTNQQLLSVPLPIPQVTTLVIKYNVSQGTRNMPLYFTRAELIY